MPKIPKVILLIETSRAFGRGILRGITRYSRLHGPWVFYREVGGLEKALPRLKDWRANGIIMRDSTTGKKALKPEFPVIVLVHFKGPRGVYPFIVPDDISIGRMAAEHFLERGFRHFGFCGFDDFYWSRGRLQSFNEAISDAGFKVHVYKQPKSRRERSWDREQMLMAKWFRSIPKPLAVLACNDDRGLHVTEACKTVGLRAPEDVAIIGVDNDDIVCELCDPPLSSVAVNTERAGYEAAELLDKMMAGRKMKNKNIIVHPTHIVTRQSTDILAIEDHEVAQAVRFIRQHAKEPIQVTDVVDAAALSRRVLEKRFRKVLNHSVLEEIRRVRIDRVVRMLVDTNLSVSKIASALGYPSVKHIARYFRREKMMSLVAYRKQYGRK